MKTDKILVIDDEQPTLKMFSLLLSAYGHEVLTAENGQMGVDVFREQSPWLVLTDIKMPIMDGIEVLKRIKAINPHTEVIVITGHGDMDLAIQALNLDATDFINKPLQREALEKALERAKERLDIAHSEEEQITIEERPGATVVRVCGNVTGHTVPHLTEAFDKALATGTPTILIDFDANASINGAGITGLKALLSGNQGKGVRIVLAGLSSNFRAVFASVGITRLAALFDNETEALAAD